MKLKNSTARPIDIKIFSFFAFLSGGLGLLLFALDCFNYGPKDGNTLGFGIVCLILLSLICILFKKVSIIERHIQDHP